MEIQINAKHSVEESDRDKQEQQAMTLITALETIGYDSGWGIWAELIDGQLKPESEARYGQAIFENGGLLDDFVFVCSGEKAGDHISEWQDDDGDLIDGWFEELIDPINRNGGSDAD
jgi:hypothetical protein